MRHLRMFHLHDDPDEEAFERHTRLAQRIVTWLTSTTAAGTLYDTDVRLRPDGAAGLMVSSLASFRRYQREQAWTWEHQALTRARFVAGDTAIGAAFEAEREAILCSPCDRAALRADVGNAPANGGRPSEPTALFDLHQMWRHGRRRICGPVSCSRARSRAADAQCR
jgi:hypothetical protein